MNLPTTSIILWPRPLVNGEHMARLRVTYQRRTRYYSLGVSCLPDKWNAEYARLKPANDPNNQTLSAVESRARMIVSQYQIEGIRFEWAEFERRMWGTSKAAKDAPNVRLSDLIRQEAQKLYDQERFSSYYLRLAAAVFVDEHWPGIEAQALTQDWYLDLVERLKQHYAGQTVYNYAMSVRTAIRAATRDGRLPRGFAPFDPTEAPIKKGKSTKRAITQAELDLIKSAPVEPGSTEAWARDLFLLSYHLRGINLADLAELRKDRMSGTRVEYYRKKTAHHGGGALSMPMTDEVQQIAARWPGQGPYWVLVYPSVPRSAREALTMLSYANLQINTSLKALVQRLGLPAGLRTFTFYVARHTFATTLSRKNVPLRAISQALGHSSLAYTEVYLKELSPAEVDAAVGQALAV